MQPENRPMKKSGKYTVLFILLGSFFCCCQQQKKQDINQNQTNTSSQVDTTKMHYRADKMPTYPGGLEALNSYIAQNTKYPPKARKKDINGKVYIKFAILPNGSVDSVTVERSLNKIVDKEAVKVINSLPKWEPGKKNGQSVGVWYTIPVPFPPKKTQDSH